MRHYKIIIEYDGTGLAGWQYQPNSPSVQEYLEKALTKLTGETVRIFCAGRTDAGVHALAQVGSFTLQADRFSPSMIRGGMNFHIEKNNIFVI